MRIALFGGSFDPPHLGHVLAACYARVVAGVDAVWILPVVRHPYGKRLAPLAQRLELCHLAFGPLGSWAEVRREEERNPTGYTFDLIQLLRAEHPDHRWCLIGGSDTARDLPNWHRGRELAGMVEVIAVPRRAQGGDDHPAALPAISSSAVRQRLTTGARADDLLPPAVAVRIAACGWYGPDRGNSGQLTR
jgi:nicotinate-nucleotide adenylyltransferase